MERINFRDRIVGNVKKTRCTLCNGIPFGQSESFPLQSDTTNARAQKSFETFLIAGQTPGLGFEV